MGIGPKLKELRCKVGLTQKEIAERLCVTYQAVSRWENDDAEPSLDTLIEMCEIFGCSMNEIMGIEETKEENKVQVIEKIVVQEGNPVLGVCEKCNKPIYDGNDLKRVDVVVHHARKGRHSQSRQMILCNACNEKRSEEIKREEERQKQIRLEKMKKRRIHSFIWPSIVAIGILIGAIVSFVNGNNVIGAFLIVTSILSFMFLATLILDNTDIVDFWLETSTFGFVKFPGIIFELSIDGIIFLITVKLLLLLISIALGILAFCFATSVSMLASIVAYPVALHRNLKGTD